MRVLKWILGVVVVLAVVFVAGGFLMPREVTVTRDIVINAPAEEVFPLVNSLQEGQKWSPWLERDPDVELTYEGPESGVGNKMSWASEVDTVGNGTQEITVSTQNERVETALDFGTMGTAKAAFILAADGAGTKVTWNLVSDMGNNPMGRWMGLMMDGWVGPDYEKGLGNLKALVEGG